MKPQVVIGHIILMSASPIDEAQWLMDVFGWEQRSVQLDGQCVELLTPTNRLDLIHPEAMATFCGRTLPALTPENPPSIALSLEVETLEPVLSRALNKGATLTAAATFQPWGLWTAFIVTPFGLMLELCSPVA